jgi:hypothetical protein
MNTTGSRPRGGMSRVTHRLLRAHAPALRAAWPPPRGRCAPRPSPSPQSHHPPPDPRARCLLKGRALVSSTHTSCKRAFGQPERPGLAALSWSRCLGRRAPGRLRPTALVYCCRRRWRGGGRGSGAGVEGRRRRRGGRPRSRVGVGDGSGARPPARPHLVHAGGVADEVVSDAAAGAGAGGVGDPCREGESAGLCAGRAPPRARPRSAPGRRARRFRVPATAWRCGPAAGRP